MIIHRTYNEDIQMPLWGNTDSSGDEPKFNSQLENMDTSNFTVFGVDAAEVGAAQTTAYAGVAHEGWVGVTTYMDNHGELRVKQEVLVAMNIVSGDQADDDVFRDS